MKGNGLINTWGHKDATGRLLEVGQIVVLKPSTMPGASYPIVFALVTGFYSQCVRLSSEYKNNNGKIGSILGDSFPEIPMYYKKNYRRAPHAMIIWHTQCNT
jgi:hypothetical protein